MADVIAEAISAVSRSDFVAEVFYREAGQDAAIPIGHGVTSTRPSRVETMLRLLGVRGRVLEIGTGCGWQTAILSRYAEVYSIERIERLHARAARDLAGYPVHLRHGDGLRGWPEAAPFDGIILCAAVPKVPSALLSQLADPGVLVAPIGDGKAQYIARLSTNCGEVRTERQGVCGFSLAA